MTRDSVTKHRVRPGGLLRCCVLTITELPDDAKPKEGDELQCAYCTDGRMVFKAGAYEWAGLELVVQAVERAPHPRV